MKYIKEFEKFSLRDRILYNKGTNYQRLVRTKILEFAKDVFRESWIEPYTTKRVYNKVSFKKNETGIGFIDIQDSENYIRIWCSFISDKELDNFMMYIKSKAEESSFFWNSDNGYRIHFGDIENFLSELTMEKYELHYDMQKYNL